VSILRVFPQQTAATPDDGLAFIGEPPLLDAGGGSRYNRDGSSRGVRGAFVLAQSDDPRSSATATTEAALGRGSSYLGPAMVDDIIIAKKTCTQCGQSQSVSEYHRKAATKDGHSPWCKACTHTHSARYYAEHRDEQQQKSAAYYRQHCEQAIARAAAWGKANRDKARRQNRDARRRRRLADPDRYRNYDRELYHREPQKRREQARAWRARHPAAVKRANQRRDPDVCRDMNARRRARLRGVMVEKFTRRQIYERDAGRCHLCGRRVKPNRWHLDHIIPLSKGGVHARWNVAVSCPTCNERKYNKPLGQPRLPQ